MNSCSDSTDWFHELSRLSTSNGRRWPTIEPPLGHCLSFGAVTDSHSERYGRQNSSYMQTSLAWCELWLESDWGQVNRSPLIDSFTRLSNTAATKKWVNPEKNERWRISSLSGIGKLESLTLTYTEPWASILVHVTIYRRFLIGRDGHLDQSETYDIS